MVDQRRGRDGGAPAAGFAAPWADRMTPRLSIVVPALNEAPNIAPLVVEIERAFADRGGAIELILVDDGSTDETLARMTEAAAARPWVRVLHRRKRAGQSAAFHAGIRAAKAQWIGMLDADLQNDPADLPRLMEALAREGADWAQGTRRRREDGAWRAFSSWVGRTFRRAGLGDTVRDTGCSCRVFRREIGLALPLQYAGLHRFMPVYARRLGYRVIEVDVAHRDRAAGRAKYGALNRALPGLIDLFAVRWMFRRLRDVRVDERAPAREEGAEAERVGAAETVARPADPEPAETH